MLSDLPFYVFKIWSHTIQMNVKYSPAALNISEAFDQAWLEDRLIKALPLDHIQKFILSSNYLWHINTITKEPNLQCSRW